MVKGFFTKIKIFFLKLFGKKIYAKGRVVLRKNATLTTSYGGKITILGGMEGFSSSCISAPGGKIVIGKNFFINRNSVIVSREEIVIGDNVAIGPNVIIYDHDHDHKKGGGYLQSKIEIGNNVWIGGNVTILRGVKIGDNAVIGAGSVIYCDVPKNSLLVQKRENTIIENGEGL